MQEWENTVLSAKTDDQSLADLIHAHKPWILRTASEITRRYITDSDDEWSVALMAFSEAVQAYQPDRGASFPTFARTVIQRRLLDHARGERRRQAEIIVLPGAFEGGLSEEEANGVSLEVESKLAEQSAENLSSRTKEEIDEVQEALARYGFSLFDLTESSPKAEKTKAACALAVRALLADRELWERAREKGTLPMKELSRSAGVSRKLLDRHRKYILAAAEILTRDLPILAAYVDFIRKGEQL